MQKLGGLSMNLIWKGCSTNNRVLNSTVLSSSYALVCKRKLSNEYSDNSSSQAGKWFMLLFPAAGVMLGTWQVRRKQWKLDLIKALDEKTHSEPVQLPNDLNKLPDLEYRPVSVRGAFIHSNEIYVEPRHFIEKETNQTSSAGSLITFQSGNVGAQIITPFFIPERGIAILVNRGFVPREKRDPKTRLEGQVEGIIDINGIVRRSEKRSPFTPKHNPESNQWNYKDIDEMATALNTRPILIDAINSVPGGPIGGQTRVTLRDEHIQYAATWFSLAFITSVMWYYRYIHKPVPI